MVQEMEMPPIVNDSSSTVAHAPDPRRWLLLGIVLMATVIVVLDGTVLNVAIPTILRDFHTTLPSLEWVITGYALTFATFLVIGGRLGDVVGHRRIFIIGAALFGVGSLLASMSWNVGSLVVGEAVIEGLGASLMLPAALATLSTTFEGKERGAAFAAWGAVSGAAVGLGPVVGGLLTTDFSWRWSFRINVIIAPIAIVGAVIGMRKATKRAAREPLDIPGAAMIAVGMFLLVFGLSEGGTYGWLRPISTVTLGNTDIWPSSWAVSIIPVIFVASAIILSFFYRHERNRGRANAGPLFDFDLLEHRTFRYGLLTTIVASMGQLGFSFTLALFLQEAKHLSALDNGLWVLPYGIAILVGSAVGGRLTHRFGAVNVVRLGMGMQALGLFYIALTISTSLTFWGLFPILIFYGAGIGMAMSQLTNVILSEIAANRSGVASGTNTTVKQVGAALGIAVIGTVISTQTINQATSGVGAAQLSPAVKAQAVKGIHDFGANYLPPQTGGAGITHTLRNIVSSAAANATHDALLFAAAVVTIGAILSFLIPRIPVVEVSPMEELIEDLQPFSPLQLEGAELAP
jgi:EmrB/QacA subfamily drug resistance transporter